LSPAEHVRARQRLASEALFDLDPGFDVFVAIARAVADGLAWRGAALARCDADGGRLKCLGAWLDGAPCPGESRTPATASPGSDFDEAAAADALLASLPPPWSALPVTDCRTRVVRDNAGHAMGLLLAVDGHTAPPDPDEEALLKLAAARARVELERQLADERLRESEARMRVALEAGALGMWEWDLEHQTWVYNDRWAEMRGYRPGEITPEFADWHPDEEARLRSLRDAAMNGALDAYEVDYRTITRDGWRWINARTKVIKRDERGRPLRIIGVQTDIHERRLAEEAARANQQWLMLAVDATELGLWDWDAATDRVEWTPRCASMLGYAVDELPATSLDWIALNHPDDQAEAAYQFREHVCGRLPFIRAEIRCRAKDGSWVWVLSHGRVIARDERGRALRAVGTHQDITQIKLAAEAVRASETRLRAVFDHSPVGIFLAEADGTIGYCNPAILHLAGTGLEGLKGAAWLRFVHAEDRVRVERQWERFIADPVGVYDAEWRGVTARGEHRIRVRAAAIRDDGRVVGFAGALEDVTEQRAAEERERQLEVQLQQSQKVEAIGRLTGGIAHDFNNSLAAIIGFTSLAQRLALPHAKLNEYLDTVLQAAEHSRELVRKLLDFSRSAPAEDLVPLDAGTGILAATRMLQAMIPSTVRIATALPDELPTVRIDATGLQQILFNLVLNSSDAIDSHGEVAIELHASRRMQGYCIACHRRFDDEYVELVVRDSGCGISREALVRIFDPFYSTKPIGHGTGMGLAVLHGIVHRAGGHIQVESALGAGTTMHVLLRPGPPRGESTDPEASGTEALPDAAAAYRVLVVDDEPALVGFLCEWLECEGHVGIPFTDATNALAWASGADARFDLLLTDQTMPGMTGLELARSLRAERPTLPVVLCTGLADRVNEAEARALGIDRLWLKPVPLDDLREALLRAAARAA